MPLKTYITSVPTRSIIIFLAGVFFLFAVIPLANDMSEMGRQPSIRFALSALVVCTFAIGYASAGFLLRQRSWKVMVPLCLVQVLIFNLLHRRWPSLPGPTQMDAAEIERLASRLNIDAIAIILAMTIGYTCFVYFSVTEGKRYFRAHAEIALAQEIHRVLVPTINIQMGGFEFYGRSSPSGEVGGDLIDLAGTNENWVAYLADVSGHGVAPGIVMGMVKSASRTLLTPGTSGGPLMPRLNEVLFPLKTPDMFITFCFVAKDGDGLRVGLAGHPSILHFSPSSGQVDELSCPNMPLGIVPSGDFTTSQIAAEPGSLFALYTDGFLEAANAKGQEFGIARLKEQLRSQAREPLENICDGIRESVARHGAQFDDQSILLIRRL
jgi:hypothetical protein